MQQRAVNAVTETDINTWIEDLNKGEVPCEFSTTHKPQATVTQQHSQHSGSYFRQRASVNGSP